MARESKANIFTLASSLSSPSPIATSLPHSERDGPVVPNTITPHPTPTAPPSELIVPPTTAVLSRPSKSANATEQPTSFDLLSPAYLTVFPIFVVVLFVMAWLLMMPTARRPWSCRSHRRDTPLPLRQRGPGDAYEIEPQMWRGGGRFVGESTRTRDGVGEGERYYTDGSSWGLRRTPSTDMERERENTRAAPATPGQDSCTQHFNSEAIRYTPSQIHVNVPPVFMAPGISTTPGRDGIEGQNNPPQSPPPYQSRVEQDVGSVRLVGEP